MPVNKGQVTTHNHIQQRTQKYERTYHLLQLCKCAQVKLMFKKTHKLRDLDRYIWLDMKEVEHGFVGR